MWNKFSSCIFYSLWYSIVEQGFKFEQWHRTKQYRMQIIHFSTYFEAIKTHLIQRTVSECKFQRWMNVPPIEIMKIPASMFLIPNIN